MNSKKIIFLIIFFITSNLTISKAYSTEECFENASRKIFNFNQGVDNYVLKPIAKGYDKLPKAVKTGTNNFTSNIATLLSIPNSILQGNLNQVGQSAGSFLINSSIGILGIFNPAEKIGLKPHKEDVGQTLGSYGIGTGCYFVLPILGPTTARDSIGLLADTFIDPFAHITIRENELFSVSGNSMDYFSVKGATAIDFRSNNLTNIESLEKNSLDLYSSIKSIYLQDRENKISNSNENQDDWGNLDN